MFIIHLTGETDKPEKAPRSAAREQPEPADALAMLDKYPLTIPT